MYTRKVEELKANVPALVDAAIAIANTSCTNSGRDSAKGVCLLLIDINGACGLADDGVPYWSNPDVKYPPTGEPMGTADRCRRRPQPDGGDHHRLRVGR
jgi:hypothetical protein